MKKTDDNNKRQPDSKAAFSITEDRKKQKPELLSPAGELAGVIGAIHAGADAVYLGAEAFSARAYAKNLNAEELLQALDYAHAFGRKIYLACNILLRDHELEQIPGIIDPLYEHGLDGVIVQDLGLVSFLHQRYPSLPLHASTQMSVLSAAGAEWLKRMNICRVVPGRELSLEELRALKERAIEVECFIHGAMCYSYSGRCLLSSFAGGRSGNRGRCAGPCRQPYHMAGEASQYVLSLKDMWSLHEIGALIDTGIDSFKIEGRMKAPEYTAGVTAVYRKYIDQYLLNGGYQVEEKDVKRLEALYLRSGKQEGYLRRHNGKDMVSLSSPAYGKVSEEEKQRVAQSYLTGKKTIPLKMQARIFAGEPIRLTVQSRGEQVSVKGAIAETAQTRAMTEEQFREKLSKTGGTMFSMEECRIDTDGNSFVPVGMLNELRRSALAKLWEKICPLRKDLRNGVLPEVCTDGNDEKSLIPVLRIGVKRLDVIGELLLLPQIEGLILDLDAVMGNDTAELVKRIHSCGKKVYLRLPEIQREKDSGRIRSCLEKLRSFSWDGVYLNGIDALGITEGMFAKEQLHGDTGLYVFNRFTEQFLLKQLSSYTLSPEKAGREYRGMLANANAECVLYGYLPVMYSANCVRKTLHGCDPDRGTYFLEDEKGHRFPILPVHLYCYNIMYNCVPLSLHAELENLRMRNTAGVYRLEFTVEDNDEIVRIAKAYAELWENGSWESPFRQGQMTRGHFARGAE